ncbi:MAG: helix-turn-helix domain-containing protein [Candidatus Cryptobacteroides sp.]
MFELFILSCFSAGGRDYFCKNIDIEQGLAQSSVTELACDTYGSVWVGSRCGLNEYRKGKVVKFFPLGYVYMLFVDSSQNLWVGAQSGLYRLDRIADDFIQVSSNKVYCACESSEGLLFSGDGFILREKKDEFLELSFPGQEFLGVHEYKGQILLCDKKSGLYKLRDDKLQALGLKSLQSEIILNSELCGEDIYLVIFRKGLLRLRLSDYRSTLYSSANSNLSSDIISSLLVWNEQLWIGSDGGGVDVLYPESGEIRRFDSPTKSVTALYMDEFRNLWIGSSSSGLYAIRESHVKCFNVLNSILPSNVINDFAKDDKGGIWIATDNGLCLMDPQDLTLKSFPQTSDLKILSIVPLSSERILMSVYGRGLCIFDTRNGRFGRVVAEGEAPLLKRLPDGHILIISDEVYDYDFRTDSYQTFSREEQEPHLAILGYCQGNRGYSLIYGPRSVYLLNLDTHKLSFIDVDVDGSRINTALLYGDNLYLGTTSGVFLYHLKEGFTEKMTNIVDANITFISVDGNGHLYYSAGNVLYHISEKALRVLDEGIGLPDGELRHACTLEDGRYLMGGTKGLFVLDPAVMEGGADGEKELAFMDFELDAHRVHPAAGELRVYSGEHKLAVRLWFKDTDPFLNRAVRYSVKGEGGEWMEVSFEDYAQIPMMQDGDYELCASYYKENGEWSEAIRICGLKFVPVWYKTELFALICIMLLLIILAISGYYLNSLWRQKRQQQKMEKHAGFLEKVDKFIEENISSPSLGVASLASYMAMSRASLYARFKELKGMGISDYIEEIKMRKACELLSNTTLSVSEVAYSLGYTSPRYFSTRFKSRFGCPPRVYKSKS